MGRKNTVRQLEPRIRAEVDRLLADGRHTLDQILAHLRTLGTEPPSRSALGRYAQNFEKVAARLRQSREMARALVQDLGPESIEGEQGRILVESMRTLTFDILHARLGAEENGKYDAKEIAALSRSVRELSQAMRMEQDFARRIKDEARREAQEEMREKLDSAAQNGSLDPETAAEARRIMGFVD